VGERERSEQEEGDAAMRLSWASASKKKGLLLASLMGSLEEEGAAAIRLSWARSKKKALLLFLRFCG
jgi:hypothetical protein